MTNAGLSHQDGVEGGRGKPILQIVWHSRTGASRQLARAAAQAARDEARPPDEQARAGGEDHQSGADHISPAGKDSARPAADPSGPTGQGPGASGQPRSGAAMHQMEHPERHEEAQRVLHGGMHGPGADSVVIRCDHARRATTTAMLEASGYLFVAPENLATMSGVMKDFFDRQYYPLLDRIQGRPAAVIVSAGSDGQGAVRQIERILTGWRLRLVAESLIVRVDAQTPAAILAPKHLTPAQLEPAAELGRALAAGLAMGIF